MTTTCPCPPQIKHLFSTLPKQGPFEFSFLPTITQPLTDVSQSIEACKHPYHNSNQDLTTPLVDLSDAVLSLCHAACTTYHLLDDELGTAAGNGTTTATPTSTADASSPLRCTKSPMALGKLTLHAEEETLLARQVVYAVLTRLSTLLRSVYVLGKEAAGGDPANGATATATATVVVDFDLGMALGRRSGLYGRESDGPVSQCLSRVLALLGRLFPA
ncbi:hypothetical protein IFM58399_06539 [Aspergillus lentulus]|uniref:Uncharacterized protein n=1 Tax=Aspergillus lentulus TaxID=293939 RepID=A0AAN5YM63_ASPLE|nr:uncharacterized protein IFM58399_06539 [Aspergillus lentulus]KAF4157621.1 hypothetical protein CNMCM6069_005395 [Aspergillus lentulus]KAF4169236.1 hypothetical protein CNMCM6936_009233 [Aspergillus lentulus]KAF4177615.1 hypothetical protein CNMCM8060_005408 [Aspergillus lentulus]KAF4183692.1 hypothetical protein CNMCM7927_008909 [Aspergillus lentulus]KAF4199594.1 hypothetical protein CNMCM8694_003343 [Aspergillus lentulus]